MRCKIIFIILLLILTINIVQSAPGDLQILFPEETIYNLDNINYQSNLNRYLLNTTIQTTPIISSITYDITSIDLNLLASSQALPIPVTSGTNNLQLFDNGFFGGTWEITVIALDATQNVIDTDTVRFTLELLTFQQINIINYIIEDAVTLIETITDLDQVINTISNLIEITKESFNEIYQNTLQLVTIEKSAKIVQVGLNNKTRVNIEITPEEPLTDLIIIEYIPKELVESADQIRPINLPEGATFTILEDDPLMMWHFKQVDTKVNLEYEIEIEVDVETIEQTKTILLAEEAVERYKKSKSIWTIIKNNIIPILLIPVVAFILLFLSRFIPHGKKEEEIKTNEEILNKEKSSENNNQEKEDYL
ncbi:hypothetical protein ACFL1H_07570 [Nanoarchaeota archaeon]